ncbi:SDR family oxidoreductase [Novosphingobium sp.]|uniref:SDR family NAD(P)-dependent oxidoreductase n=1 Tax=Novosphingobium sp. TaxID=1874826 RepID=UPI00262BC759|nr:SDR family oxidoreductase [Novosphingobium sp.]
MQTVIITGASRGIGRDIARACAAKGMAVIATYRTGKDEAQALVRQIAEDGGEAAALYLDVARSDTFAAFRDEVRSLLADRWGAGALGALVNNAGEGGFEPIETFSEKAFDALYRVHLKGPFFLTQALLPLFAHGGSIVNIGSATTRVASVGVAPYAAFKGGLETLTRYMAKEFGPRGIRVNTVAPGAVHTGLAGGIPAEFVTMVERETAHARVGEVEDISGVVAALLGPEMAWVNAQRIEVSGGYFI